MQSSSSGDFLEGCEDLRQFFEEGMPASPANTVRDGRRADLFKSLFGRQDAEDYCLYCKTVSFDEWLGRYIATFEQRATLDVPFSKVLFQLMHDNDLARLERELDVERFPEVDEYYFIGGFYDRVRSLKPWGTGTDATSATYVDHEVIKKALTKNESFAFPPEAWRRLPVNREDSLRLCKQFQGMEFIGNTPAMIGFYDELTRACKAIPPANGKSPITFVVVEPGLEQELCLRAIATLGSGNRIRVTSRGREEIPSAIKVPALCNRRNDIPLLLRHWLSEPPATVPLADFRFPLAHWCVEQTTPRAPKACDALWELSHLVRSLMDRSVVLANTDPGTSQTRGMAAGHSMAISSDVPQAVFRKEGDFWEIVFMGRPCRLNHMKGLAYIHALLTSPEQEIHALDLIRTFEKPAPGVLSGMDQAEMAAHGLMTSELTDLGDTLDEKALTDYRNRLKYLNGGLAKAEARHDAGAADIREEIAAIEGQLAAAYGLHGHRAASSDAERPRKAVYSCIRDALERIRRNHPELHAHLKEEKSIKTGFYCQYVPPSSVRWSL